MEETKSKRIVAIVGRPNVGKSALFNRLVGRRVSIVHEEVGVTRDRVACEANWNGERFELIDTGGLGYVDDKETRDLIEGGMRQQVSVAIEDAASIILAVRLIPGGIHRRVPDPPPRRSGRQKYDAYDRAIDVARGEGERKDSAPRFAVSVNICDVGLKSAMKIPRWAELDS